MPNAQWIARTFQVHDRTYALFLLCGLLWLPATILSALATIGADVRRGYYQTESGLTPIESFAREAEPVLNTAVLYFGVAVLVVGLVALIGSFHCRRHYPLAFLRLLLFAFPFALGLVALDIFPPEFLFSVSILFSLTVIGVSLAWFLVVRRRARQRGTTQMLLSGGARRRCARALVWIGGVGLVVWPVAWIVHFRHVVIGGGTSSHPMFTIYLGFVPFALLLVTGLALIPIRRGKRRSHGDPPLESV